MTYTLLNLNKSSVVNLLNDVILLWLCSCSVISKKKVTTRFRSLEARLAWTLAQSASCRKGVGLTTKKMQEKRNLKLPLDVMIEFVFLPAFLERVYLSNFWTKLYKLTKWFYGHFFHPLLFSRTNNWINSSEMWRICSLGLQLSFEMQSHAQPGRSTDTEESDSQPLLSSDSSLRVKHRNGLPPATKSSQSRQTPPDVVTHAASLPVVILRIDDSFLHSRLFKYERRQIETFSNPIVHIQKVCDAIQAKKFPPGANQSSQSRLLFAGVAFISQTYNSVLYFNSRAATKYDSTNPGHERLLKSLWESLTDTELESRISDNWKIIGFQGKDPSTDFRATGMLGLENLLYFAENHPRVAKETLTQSWGGKYINEKEMSMPPFQPGPENAAWYPWATVSISMTQFAVELARTRQLQRLYYEAAGKCAVLNMQYANSSGTPMQAFETEQDWQKDQMRIVRTVFQELFCHLMVSFHKKWINSQPLPSVMDFNRVFADFKRAIQIQLQTDASSCVLDTSCLR